MILKGIRLRERHCGALIGKVAVRRAGSIMSISSLKGGIDVRS